LLWNSKQFAHKRLVLQLAFADRLAFCPNQGFRNLKTTLPSWCWMDSARRLTVWRREWYSNPLELVGNSITFDCRIQPSD
jgi:hypothetical protein